jgi:hypothetical protein
LVPCVLWPEKPDLERLAMQRAYDAGIVLEETSVSAKSSLYIDAYLSGGALAIVLACLIYTSLFAFWLILDRAFSFLWVWYGVRCSLCLPSS